MLGNQTLSLTDRFQLSSHLYAVPDESVLVVCWESWGNTIRGKKIEKLLKSPVY